MEKKSNWQDRSWDMMSRNVGIFWGVRVGKRCILDPDRRWDSKVDAGCPPDLLGFLVFLCFCLYCE